jgi:hypothetical protein
LSVLRCGRGRSRTCLLHGAAIARIIGFPALGQNLRLFDPLLAFDAPRQTQGLVHTIDVGGGPAGNILERAHAQSVQTLIDRLVDGPDAQEIIAARLYGRGRSRSGSSRHCRWRRGGLYRCCRLSSLRQ